jgi:hypothetical protein
MDNLSLRITKVNCDVGYNEYVMNSECRLPSHIRYFPFLGGLLTGGVRH